MTLSTQEIMLIHQGVSEIALEKDLTEEQQQELFNEAISVIIKSRVKVSKRKRHKQ